MTEQLYPDPETLYINRSDTFCGNCHKGANPRDEAHWTQYGYGNGEFGTPGCGQVWRKVSTDSYGMGMNDIIRNMRPDLEWVPLE
jgi:hypothetical protein